MQRKVFVLLLGFSFAVSHLSSCPGCNWISVILHRRSKQSVTTRKDLGSPAYDGIGYPWDSPTDYHVVEQVSSKALPIQRGHQQVDGNGADNLFPTDGNDASGKLSQYLQKERDLALSGGKSKTTKVCKGIGIFDMEIDEE